MHTIPPFAPFSPRPAFLPDSTQRVRDTLRRVTALHLGLEPPHALRRAADAPKADAAAWEDTEMDVRRVVL